MFEDLIPDNASFTDFLKSPQSILLSKDPMPKSGMASPFHARNFWRGKDESPLRQKRNTNDEFMDMYQFGGQSEHRLTNMFSTANRQEEDLAVIEVPRGGFKKLFDSNPPVLPTEITNAANTSCKDIPIEDDINMDDDDEDEDEDGGNGRGGGRRKFNKGLKLLSVIVKDIVVEKMATTYKEVADIILKDTIKFENLHLNSKLEIAKEEQNIKRRVYDALNVLIAAGVLIKEGKFVRKNTNNKKIIVNMKRLDANTFSSKIVS